MVSNYPSTEQLYWSHYFLLPCEALDMSSRDAQLADSAWGNFMPFFPHLHIYRGNDFLMVWDLLKPINWKKKNTKNHLYNLD